MVLNFVGTAIYLFALDDVLVAHDGLEHQNHRVNLTLSPATDQQLSFDRAIVSDTTPSGIGSPYQNTDDTTFTYSPGWQINNDFRIPITARPAAFHETSTQGASVSINFTSSVGISVNGSRSCGHGLYTAALTSDKLGSGLQETYNASTHWFISDSLLCYRGDLDPAAQYQFLLSDASAAPLALSYAKFCKVNITESTTLVSADLTLASKPELDIGLTVGPVLAVVIIVLFLLFLFFRRSHRQLSEDAESTFGDISPYILDVVAANVHMSSNTTLTASIDTNTGNGGNGHRIEAITPASVNVPNQTDSSTSSNPLPATQPNTQVPMPTRPS
ncbi:unnamed protein product [Somion occarium]|uniref:Transmembrane protein n=1 Tax=Somion occarium TaxID=3059160 RepID=A0ABP1CFA6_9APHY